MPMTKFLVLQHQPQQCDNWSRNHLFSGKPREKQKIDKQISTYIMKFRINVETNATDG